LYDHGRVVHKPLISETFQLLHYDLTSTGIALALPYLCSLIIKLVAGPFVGVRTCIGERTQIQLITTITLVLMLACFIGLAVVPASMGSVAQVIYTLAIALVGLMSIAFVRSAQMVKRKLLTIHD
jgi:hypothetical protein